MFSVCPRACVHHWYRDSTARTRRMGAGFPYLMERKRERITSAEGTVPVLLQHVAFLTMPQSPLLCVAALPRQPWQIVPVIPEVDSGASTKLKT